MKHQPVPTSTNQYQLRKISLFLLMFVIMSISKINAQLDIASKYDMCGTVTPENSHINDPFYGNNQALVDLLIENGVNISENYLNELDDRGNYKKSNLERFSSESTVYFIPIKFWVYRNNNGTGNVNTTQIQEVIDELNDIFEPVTNIQFYRLCEISFINNSAIANNGNQYFSDFTLNNRIPGVLNVHFIIDSGTSWAGKANFPFLPWDPRTYSCAVKYTQGSGLDNNFTMRELSEILSHEAGHTLGLYHTHQGRSQTKSHNEDCGNCYQESVSRTKTQGLTCISTVGQKKCEVNGDLLCDTPADPFLGKYDPEPRVNSSTCSYVYGVFSDTDNWGDTWVPDTNNIMSYTWLSCLENFSLLQTARMYYYTNWMGIYHTPFAISGDDVLCAGQTATFTVNALPGVTHYHWEVSSNLSIISGQGSTSVTVQAINHGGGELTVAPNCGNRSVNKVLTQLFSAPVSGPDTMCVGAAPKYYSTTSYPGATYNWSITNGTILNGQGTSMVQVSISSHSSNISEMFIAVNYCGSPFWGNKLITHVYSGTECNFHAPLPNNQKDVVNEEYEFIIYPNPAKEAFTIMAPHGKEFTLEIADKTGTIIYKNSQNLIYETTINADAFQTGLYFIIIKYGNKQQIKRLIIKK